MEGEHIRLEKYLYTCGVGIKHTQDNLHKTILAIFLIPQLGHIKVSFILNSQSIALPWHHTSPSYKDHIESKLQLYR